MLRDVGASNIRLEQQVSGVLCGATIWGSIDLVFAKPNGSIGLIDMKYSFSPQKYSEKITSGTDLQLTLYSELYSQTHQVLPESAFWILPLRKLLTRNGAFFLTDSIASSHSHAQRTAMIDVSVNGRRQELAQGQVEIVCQASDELVGYPKGETWDTGDPYLALYGWDSQA